MRMPPRTARVAGTVAYTIGSEGTGLGHLRWPCGVAVDAQARPAPALALERTWAGEGDTMETGMARFGGYLGECGPRGTFCGHSFEGFAGTAETLAEYSKRCADLLRAFTSSPLQCTLGFGTRQRALRPAGAVGQTPRAGQTREPEKGD